MNTNRNVVEPKEKIMQLKEKSTGRLIGNIPSSHAQTIDGCITYLGGKPVNNSDGSSQCENGKTFRIRDELYTYDDLITTERRIDDLRINLLMDDTRFYPDADNFIADCALGVGFMDPESEEVDMALIEQLRILWHTVRDPFDVFLEKLGLTAAKCCNRFNIPFPTLHEWLNGKTSAPDYIRLMMAEAVGLLTIRDLA